MALLILSVPTLDLYHIQQKIIKQKNYPQLFRENFQRSYLHLCMRNARRGSTLPAHRRRAGNVAHIGKDSWASARSAREQCAQRCGAPRPTAVGQQRPRQSLLSSARTGNTQLTYIYTSGLTLEIVDFETNLSIMYTQPIVCTLADSGFSLDF